MHSEKDKLLSGEIKVDTQITRFSWPLGLAVSIGIRPVMSSSRTTPNAYTSILLFTFPYIKYSGAKYLKRPRTSVSDQKNF